MALISTSGIQALQVIKSDHVLRIINALSGITVTDIIVSGSSNLKNLYAPSMTGPTAFTGSFTLFHTTDNVGTYGVSAINNINSGSGVYGSSYSGYGVNASSTYGIGLNVACYSGIIAKFTSNTGYEQAKLFANGNFLLNSLNSSGGNQTDTGYRLYVGGNTMITGSLSNGYLVSSSGTYSHAEGDQTKALGQGSHTEGLQTLTIGTYSHAEGNLTTGSGANSHAEGYLTISSGSNSHAEGTQTLAKGANSHAEGGITVASGQNSHTEGYYTSASNWASHAEGLYTQATNEYAHAEGMYTLASGTGSHAEGYYTVASGSYQHVQGQYNISSSAQSAFILGNGTSEANRSNLIFASGSQVQITGSLRITGSFVPPVMTSASRAALVNPATGSVVYQNDSASGLYVYKGTSWVNLTSAEIYTFLHGSQNPSPNNTYYFGNFPDAGPPQSTSDIRGKVIAQHTGLITSAVIAQYSAVNSSLEVSGTSSISLWNSTTGITSIITNNLYHTASSIASYNISPPLAVTEGDLLSIKWISPISWTIAPSSSRHRVTIKTAVIN
jgi:hypothetical protein